jgi:hypothetical protein
MTSTGGTDAAGTTAETAAHAAAAAAHPAAHPRRTSCANCGTPLVGKYCHSCGQSSAPTSVGLRDALHDILYSKLKVDTKFVRSLKVLVTKPGKLSLDHMNGIVAPYTRPLQLIFVVSLLMTVLFALADIKFIQHVMTFTPDADITRDEGGYPVLQGASEEVLATQRTVPRQTPPPRFVAALERELAKDNGWAEQRQLRLWKALALGNNVWGDFWSKGLPFLMLGIAPFVAGILALLFRGSGNMFMDHLVFAVHLNRFVLLTRLVPAALGAVSPGAADLNLELPLFAGYTVVACRTFYRASWTAAALKGVMVAALDLALFMVVAITAMLTVMAVA